MYLSKQKIFFKRSPYSDFLGFLLFFLNFMHYITFTEYKLFKQRTINYRMNRSTDLYMHICTPGFIYLSDRRKKTAVLHYIYKQPINLCLLYYIYHLIFIQVECYTKIYILLFIIIKIGRSEPILYLLYIYLCFKRKTSNIFNENKFSLK